MVLTLLSQTLWQTYLHTETKKKMSLSRIYRETIKTKLISVLNVFVDGTKGRTGRLWKYAINIGGECVCVGIVVTISINQNQKLRITAVKSLILFGMHC